MVGAAVVVDDDEVDSAEVWDVEVVGVDDAFVFCGTVTSTIVVVEMAVVAVDTGAVDFADAFGLTCTIAFALLFGYWTGFGVWAWAP